MKYVQNVFDRGYFEISVFEVASVDLLSDLFVYDIIWIPSNDVRVHLHFLAIFANERQLSLLTEKYIIWEWIIGLRK